MRTPTIISDEVEKIATLVVDAAYSVHSTLGPGLMEHIYETCFCHELHKRGLAYARQVSFPLIYDGVTFEEAIRLDVVVENQIVCELKAVETLLAVHKAQVISYLRLTGFPLGFLINFNVDKIKYGVSRYVR